MMKHEIKQELKKHHKAFAGMIRSLSDEGFMFSFNDKWNAAQQLEHICRSTSPVALALLFPNFVIKMLFGKAERTSMDYDQLVGKYHAKLAGGYKASGRYIPGKIMLDAKEKLTSKLLQIIEQLCMRLDNYSEQQLDEFILPHPLLGRLTVREMMYFTMYHVQHHHKLTTDNLAKL